MDDNDLLHARGWIGRTQEGVDCVAARLLSEFSLTFAPLLFSPPDGSAPPGFHWTLAPEALELGALGEDGQARPGGLWPPSPFARRMWAGGEAHFHAPLYEGDDVTRRFVIADAQVKRGGSGALFFVSLDALYARGGSAVVSERRDIVYRDAQGGAPAREAAPPAERLWTVEASPALLFRYSALTFNAHRIHLDARYAIEREGYRGLVVHGPLQATLALNAAALHAERAPVRFRYRARAPLFGDSAFQIGVRETGPDSVQAWTCDAEGALALTGEAFFA